jgi:hypothetical protein
MPCLPPALQFLEGLLTEGYPALKSLLQSEAHSIQVGAPHLLPLPWPHCEQLSIDNSALGGMWGRMIAGPGAQLP